MSNETENRKETVLDMLEDQAQHFADFVKKGWEHAVKASSEKGFGLPETFRAYHMATTAAFAHAMLSPKTLSTLVLGAFARELVNNMDEAQKAELACITLEQLDHTHVRDKDGNEED